MMKELKWEHKRFFYIAGSVLVLLLGLYFKSTVDNSSLVIQDSDLTTLNGLVLAENPVYVKRHGKGTNDHIEFQFKDHTKVFEITSFDYQCSMSESLILNGIKTNDTVAIKILTKTYVALKNDEISYTNIDLHSLVFRGQEYCDLKCRNEKQKNDGKFGVYMCFIMSPLLLLTGLFKNEPKLGKTKIDPSLILIIILLVLIFVLPKFI